MALRVFAYQYERRTAFRSFCDRRSANPKRIESWKQIPIQGSEVIFSVPSRRQSLSKLRPSMMTPKA